MPKRRSKSKAASPEIKSDQVIHVSSEQAGQTVSHVIREFMPGASWQQVRRLSTSNRVMINGNMCADPARRLKEGEVVKLLAQAVAKPPTTNDIRIYFLDRHLVVFEKPASITSIRHAEERGWSKRRRQRQATLDELLPEAIERKQKATGKRRGHPPRIRMVHRLDRDTSGVMVAARTVEAEQALIQQFKQHTTEREYIAICQGSIAAQTIRTQLVRDRGDGLRGSTAIEGEGKSAVTHLEPIESTDAFSVVCCRLETGRTHQIRIHLAELGHPIFGEKMYLRRLGKRSFRDDSGMPRQALHAAKLGLVHPTTGESLQFKSPLPRDMKQLLKRLRDSLRD